MTPKTFRDSVRDHIIMPEGYDEPDMPDDGSQWRWGIALVEATALVSMCALAALIWSFR